MPFSPLDPGYPGCPVDKYKKQIRYKLIMSNYYFIYLVYHQNLENLYHPKDKEKVYITV